MDYVVGSVAALISGNVTPNRPRIARKALTPIKHQPSPNVTPKSEFIDDRSIFLSPSVQKKKAIVKKSPKRIFQNHDLNETKEDANEPSPKADKVKKHLRNELEANENNRKNEELTSLKNIVKSATLIKKIKRYSENQTDETSLITATSEEHTNNKQIKKHHKRNHKYIINEENVACSTNENIESNLIRSNKIIHKKSLIKIKENNNNSAIKNDNGSVPEKKIKKQSKDTNNALFNNMETEKKAKKIKIIKSDEIQDGHNETENLEHLEANHELGKIEKKKEKKFDNKIQPVDLDYKNEKKSPEQNRKSTKKKTVFKTINPNAITDKDTESEHDSDDHIESETEERNIETLASLPREESSEDEDDRTVESKQTENIQVNTEDDIKRTLFVGNVPLSKKCKKEIKKIFNKYGQIDSVRIRTVPVKDARMTPKMAVIKNELHPERSTVNVYVKYKDPSSVKKALVENNTVLNDHHLRVSPSSTTGAEHDPLCSVFVGNIPFALEDEALRTKFDKCGPIMSVRIIRDKKTNVGKGFGYVNFASKDGVELALALTEEDLTIKNRILRVKRCSQNPIRNNSHASKGYKEKKEKTPGHLSGPPRDEKMGAYRRIANKRKSQQEPGDATPLKRQKSDNKLLKGKKSRKEFVGMTAEKKKKHKFNKGQKKKKVLSEILRN